MRSDINIIIVIVIATSEWRAPRGRVCLIQDTRCGHAWLTQIRRVPYGPGERSDAFPGRSRGLPCRWPQLWHIGIRSVLLWVTLPCAGRRKTLQLWWTTATHSRSPMLFSSHTHTHSDEQALGLWGRISSSVNSEGKTNRHQKATYGPLLMEHLSWALTDRVTRMGPVAWMFFATAVLSFIRQLYQDSRLHNFQFCTVVYFSREDDVAPAFARFESQGQLEKMNSAA